MTNTWGTTDLRDAYAALLEEWGIVRGGRLERTSGPTTSPAKVDQLYKAAEAPEALAMLAAYGDGVGLSAGRVNWGISCLPAWSRNPGRQRAATICVGRTELAHVWLTRATGEVEDWGFRVPGDFRLTAEIRHSVRTVDESERGRFLLGNGYQCFLDVTKNEGVRFAAAQAANRSREGSYRRQSNWHNPRLAVFLGLEEVAEAAAETWEVPVEYFLSMVKSRRHQAAFRRELLRSTQPTQCAVCGIAVQQVLEAAHIVSDAEGGAASFENGLLLCANHHRAMDRKVFSWDGFGPVWADETAVNANLGAFEGRFLPGAR